MHTIEQQKVELLKRNLNKQMGKGLVHDKDDYVLKSESIKSQLNTNNFSFQKGDR